MWTSIVLFLCTIGIIKHKSTSIPIGCANRVQNCPVERSQWVQKTNQLKCATHYGYVCLRDFSGYLFETCMANFTIQANLGNCPILFACVNNKPYLGKTTTFYRCPMEVSGCPSKNHTQYTIHQLYKYPKCIESSFSDAIGNTSPRSTTISTSHIEEQDNNTVIIVIIVAAVLLTALGCCIGLIVCSGKRTCGYSMVSRTEKVFSQEYGSNYPLMPMQLTTKGQTKRPNSEPSSSDFEENERKIQRHSSYPGNILNIHTEIDASRTSFTFDEKIDRYYLISLSQMLCEECLFISFARRMGLSDVEIDTIKHDYNGDGIREVSYQVLAALQKRKTLKNKREAIRILKAMNLPHMIEKLENSRERNIK